VWWGGAVLTGFSRGNLKERSHLEELGIPVSKVLEWILKKSVERALIGLIKLRIGKSDRLFHIW
jgi:hypothetical protein